MNQSVSVFGQSGNSAKSDLDSNAVSQQASQLFNEPARQWVSEWVS